MDYWNLLETFLTSFTSIVVALIGVGYFKKINDKKIYNKSKNNLIDQIDKDEIIHLSIREIRRKLNCDRICIWQFHNGGSYYSETPVQKMSITYERCSDGLEKNGPKNQSVLVSSLNSYVKEIILGKMFYSDINNMSDIGLRSLAQSSGTKSHCAIPLYDKEDNLIGILGCDWVFSEIPKDFLKKDKEFSDKFINMIKEDCISLPDYL